MFVGSAKQKEGTERVVNYLIKNKKRNWDELQAKYDPDNIYYGKYKDEATARGIGV